MLLERSESNATLCADDRPLSVVGCAARFRRTAFLAGCCVRGRSRCAGKLAGAGAKVVRVYRESDVWVLDAAQQLGLRVVMGLWLGHPRHGFRLDDARAVQVQEDSAARLRPASS
jgi:hypothetical protein